MDFSLLNPFTSSSNETDNYIFDNKDLINVKLHISCKKRTMYIRKTKKSMSDENNRVELLQFDQLSESPNETVTLLIKFPKQKYIYGDKQYILLILENDIVAIIPGIKRIIINAKEQFFDLEVYDNCKKLPYQHKRKEEFIASSNANAGNINANNYITSSNIGTVNNINIPSEIQVKKSIKYLPLPVIKYSFKIYIDTKKNIIATIDWNEESVDEAKLISINTTSVVFYIKKETLLDAALYLLSSINNLIDEHKGILGDYWYNVIKISFPWIKLNSHDNFINFDLSNLCNIAKHVYKFDFSVPYGRPASVDFRYIKNNIININYINGLFEFYDGYKIETRSAYFNIIDIDEQNALNKVKDLIKTKFENAPEYGPFNREGHSSLELSNLMIEEATKKYHYC